MLGRCKDHIEMRVRLELSLLSDSSAMPFDRLSSARLLSRSIEYL